MLVKRDWVCSYFGRLQTSVVLYVAKAGLELSDHPASVSQVLELEACTIPDSLLFAGL